MADTISAPVTSAAPSTNADSMSALADAVNGATDAAEQAAKAAAAAMATASKVSFSGRFFCVQIIFWQWIFMLMCLQILPNLDCSRN